MGEEEDYSWIKVRRHVDDETKTWEERYRALERHHEAETRFLVREVEKTRAAPKLPAEAIRMLTKYAADLRHGVSPTAAICALIDAIDGWMAACEEGAEAELAEAGVGGDGEVDLTGLAKHWSDGGWGGEDARRFLRKMLETEAPPIRLRARDRNALAYLVTCDEMAEERLDERVRLLHEVCTWLAAAGRKDAADMVHEGRDRFLLPLARQVGLDERTNEARPVDDPCPRCGTESIEPGYAICRSCAEKEIRLTPFDDAFIAPGTPIAHRSDKAERPRLDDEVTLLRVVADAARALSDLLLKDSREIEETLSEDVRQVDDLAYDDEHRALLTALSNLEKTAQRTDNPLRAGNRVRVTGGAWESSIGKLATVEHVYPSADDGSQVIRITVDGENGTLSLAASDVKRCPGRTIGDVNLAEEWRALFLFGSKKGDLIVSHLADLIGIVRAEERERCSANPKTSPLWVRIEQQCYDIDPEDKHACTIEGGHVGAHVAIDPVFGNPMAAWPQRTETATPDVDTSHLTCLACGKAFRTICSACNTAALDETVKTYSAEIHRILRFARSAACPFCGWPRGDCDCKRPAILDVKRCMPEPTDEKTVGEGEKR